MFAKFRLLKKLPFLVAFSITLRRASLFPWFGLISLRSRVSGMSGCTVWRGPRTSPFTFNWLMLSNFSSSPTGGEKKNRSAVRECEMSLQCKFSQMGRDKRTFACECEEGQEVRGRGHKARERLWCSKFSGTQPLLVTAAWEQPRTVPIPLDYQVSPFRHFGHMWLFDLWLKSWKLIPSAYSFSTEFQKRKKNYLEVNQHAKNWIESV